MELVQAIRGRRAVRQYTTQAVADDGIVALIDAAVQAPSAMNTQPWIFRVLRDQALLSDISNHSKRHLLQGTSLGEAPRQFEAMLSDENFHIFYHAPLVILISSAEKGAWSTIDCALAAQNLMLAAHDAGLGSCWIGFAQGWLNTPSGKALLGMPEDELAVAPIAIGYPAGAAAHVARRPPRIVWAAAAAG